MAEPPLKDSSDGGCRSPGRGALHGRSLAREEPVGRWLYLSKAMSLLSCLPEATLGLGSPKEARPPLLLN